MLAMTNTHSTPLYAADLAYLVAQLDSLNQTIVTWYTKGYHTLPVSGFSPDEKYFALNMVSNAMSVIHNEACLLVLGNEDWRTYLDFCKAYDAQYERGIITSVEYWQAWFRFYDPA
jgi:hypothetical protein